MLEFPKNALACQLTNRLKDIVDWVSNKCNEEWTEYYGVELMDKLVAIDMVDLRDPDHDFYQGFVDRVVGL